MKRISRIASTFAALCFLLSAQASLAGGPIDVFAIGGQSNAQGTGGDATLSPQVPAGAVLQYYNGAISAANDPVGLAFPSSAWPAFGVTYNAATGHAVLLVPSAYADTDQCKTTGVGVYDWDIGGTLAPALVANVSAAMAAARSAGYTPTYRGILWSQGEDDAGAIGSNPAYPFEGSTAVTGGPYPAGATTVAVASAAGISINETAVITLDNGATFSPTISSVSGLTVGLSTGVPAGRSIPTGYPVHVFSQADYRTCLMNMIAYFRSATTDGTTFPQLPFYISQTGGPQAGDSLGYQKVRQAQDQVAQSDPYTKIVFRGAVDFIARGMMQPGALHYLQEGYNEMGREMAKGVLSGQAGDGWRHLSANVARVALGGTLRVGDLLGVVVSQPTFGGTPWTLGPTQVVAGDTFSSVAWKVFVEAWIYSPNLSALGVYVTYAMTPSGATISFYQNPWLLPQAAVTASWTTPGATETATVTTGTSAAGNSGALYTDGQVSIGSYPMPYIVGAPPSGHLARFGTQLNPITGNLDTVLIDGGP